MEPKPPTLRFLAYLIPCISFLVAACNQQALPPGPPPPAPPAKPLSADTHADDLNPHEDPRGSQLVVAAFNLDVERVDALLAEGVDPNSRMGRYDDLLFRDKWSLSYSHIGSDRWTPLMAVAHSHREPQPDQPAKNTVEGLAAAEAERARIDPAVIAERDERRLKIAKTLLDAKANLDLDDGYGATALYSAIYERHDDLALLLIAADAKLDTKTGVYIDGTGDISPLHRATDRPHLVKAMIERGVTVNVADDSGDTPLHWAVRDNNVESVRLLLAAGADPTAKDDEGHTPAYWCQVFGDRNSPEDIAKKEIGRLLEGAMKK